MKKFILISKGKQEEWDALPEKDWQKVMDGFADWAVAIKEKGNYLQAMSLDKKKSEILKKQDNYIVVDGPFSESKEVLTGLFIIEVESYEVALELAKKSPTLLFDTIDIYQSGV